MKIEIQIVRQKKIFWFKQKSKKRENLRVEKDLFFLYLSVSYFE